VSNFTIWTKEQYAAFLLQLDQLTIQLPSKIIFMSDTHVSHGKTESGNYNVKVENSGEKVDITITPKEQSLPAAEASLEHKHNDDGSFNIVITPKDRG